MYSYICMYVKACILIQSRIHYEYRKLNRLVDISIDTFVSTEEDITRNVIRKYLLELFYADTYKYKCAYIYIKIVT